MKLPNFICVGAQKAGTSTLYHLLNQHPDICLPKEKETHFFLNGNDKYDKGVSWYSKYFFKKCSTNKILGEISPGYMYMPYVPKRIFNDIGQNVKLIFLLRNPIERAYSGYLMSKRIDEEPYTFLEALKKEEERIKQNETFQKMYSYKNRGLYAKQIENYLKYFPIENMFFIVFETDLLKNTESTMYELCNFLSISPFNFKTEVQINSAREPKNKTIMHFLYSEKFLKLRKKLKYLLPSKKLRNKLKFTLSRMNSQIIKTKETIPADTIIELQAYFFEDIKLLEKITGKDLSPWLDLKEV